MNGQTECHPTNQFKISTKKRKETKENEINRKSKNTIEHISHSY